LLHFLEPNTLIYTKIEINLQNIKNVIDAMETALKRELKSKLKDDF
jgi:hypothetical protein